MFSKKFTILFSIALLVFNYSCKKDTYIAPPAICPLVISTDPTTSALLVPLTSEIKITFNEELNSSTVNSNSIILIGTSPISGKVSYSGVTAIFKPDAPLDYNTTYTGKVKTTIKDKLGNALQKEYIWTFSTGAILSPVVIYTDPADKDSNVVLNKIITATFNMPMDSLSFSAASFIVKKGNTSIAGTVSYTNSIATFTPDSELLSNTLYNATITTTVKNTVGTKLANNYNWSFTTGIFIAPTVISTDPANNATNVLLNKTIAATFSMPMDPLTINGTNYILKLGNTQVAGVVTYTRVTASFQPMSNLLPSTKYTASISTKVKNVAGLALVKEYSWSFTTGNLIAPFVILTDPLNGAVSVALNKVISATFNMPMDGSTITNTSFIVKAGNNTIPGIISSNGNIYSFTPTNNLSLNTIYNITLTTSIKNTLGTTMAGNYNWSFTTLAPTPPIVIVTDPADNEIDVPLDQIISATFSNAMDATTFNNSSFKVYLGLNPVSGNVSYSGVKAVFTPASKLLSGNTYTCTITTAVKNQAGTSLATDYIWTFKTKAPLGPKAPDLKSVGRFGIMSGAGISNNAGFSKINNLDVGITPAGRSSITGFPPATINNGNIYAADDASPVPAMLTQAMLDLTNAYLYAEGATTPAPASVSGDQGGKTLAPGIYKSTSTLLVQSGDLTLDAKGDVNAVWIFQVASGFTTVGGAGGNIILIGGAQAKNIYWQTGSSATIGDNTNFKGNILALTSITLNANATVTGRVLCQNGSVVMTSSNTISKP